MVAAAGVERLDLVKIDVEGFGGGLRVEKRRLPSFGHL
jgi:hypothetical protein